MNNYDADVNNSNTKYTLKIPTLCLLLFKVIQIHGGKNVSL